MLNTWRWGGGVILQSVWKGLTVVQNRKTQCCFLQSPQQQLDLNIECLAFSISQGPSCNVAAWPQGLLSMLRSLNAPHTGARWALRGATEVLIMRNGLESGTETHGPHKNKQVWVCGTWRAGALLGLGRRPPSSSRQADGHWPPPGGPQSGTWGVSGNCAAWRGGRCSLFQQDEKRRFSLFFPVSNQWDQNGCLSTGELTTPMTCLRWIITPFSDSKDALSLRA